MSDKPRRLTFIDLLFSILCFIYVWILIHYSLFMWESRQRYSLIFLALTLMLAILLEFKKESFLGIKGIPKQILVWIFFLLAVAGGIYFWVEYPSLVWERAGDINMLDVAVSLVYVYLVIQFTWRTSGPIIPTVTLVFVAYGLFGYWFPGVLHHPPISFSRFMELSCAEINGIFGMLNQIGATWIAIFAFFAGFVQGFGGLDWVIRGAYHLVGVRKTGIPQVAVLASMGFGGMSGSAGANAAGTGSFTIPTMKRFGMPPAIAASIESVASSGGQIMPPILGAVAFVMCDYLDMYYYEVLLASVWASILFFGSTMLSTHFLAKRYIDPNSEVDVPEELKEKPGLRFALEGVPIAMAFAVLLFVFIVYKVNILIGGFYIILTFLICRFVYELVSARGKPVFIRTFLQGVYKGTLRGATMMISIGAMLGSLGIVIRVLTTTGLGEKISYYMVATFGDTLFLLLFFTMIICIIFGMAVTTVAAYILVVTLAAPALLKVGIDPLVAHFAVFYWAMLSAITPPVAAVCVITAGIAKANFLKTAWESMKLGFPKFIMPFLFVTYAKILSFSLEGFGAFLIASVGFIGLSAGIQSGWGWWQQILLMVLSMLVLFSPVKILAWISMVAVIVLFPIMWKAYSKKVVPVGGNV